MKLLPKDKDIILGFPISIPGIDDCSICKGTGVLSTPPSHTTIVCPFCNGTGKALKYQEDKDGEE